MRTVFVFPGMGSQYPGMGADFYRHLRVFREQIDALDEEFVRAGGPSFRDIIAIKPRMGYELTDISLSGVAIFAVEWSMASTLREMQLEPDLVLGASLGVFAAIAVAGGVSPLHAMSAIYDQGQVVERTCQEGAMVAVLVSADQLQDDPALAGLCEIAGVNYDEHCVLSLPREHLSAVQNYLRRRGLVHSVLPVRRAFHSHWIDASREGLLRTFGRLDYEPTRIPVVCCSNGQPIRSLTEQTVWNAVRGPIRFADTVQGLERGGLLRYVDCGPSATLATFLKYLLPVDARSRVFPLMAPFGDDMARLSPLTATLLRDRATQPCQSARWDPIS